MTTDLKALIAFSRAATKGPWERGAFIVAASPSVVEDIATRLMKAEAALKRRPIAEADPGREDQEYYTVVPGQGIHSITWYEGAKKWKTHALSKHEITHFYDFAALTQGE